MQLKTFLAGWAAFFLAAAIVLFAIAQSLNHESAEERRYSRAWNDAWNIWETIQKPYDKFHAEMWYLLNLLREDDHAGRAAAMRRIIASDQEKAERQAPYNRQMDEAKQARRQLAAERERHRFWYRIAAISLATVAASALTLSRVRSPRT